MQQQHGEWRHSTATTATAWSTTSTTTAAAPSTAAAAPPPPPGPTLGVTVNDNSFSPQSGSVTTGGTVTWTWAAGAATHNITFEDNQGNSGNLSSPASHPRTFTNTGTFRYRCTLHSTAAFTGMAGEITVVP